MKSIDDNIFFIIDLSIRLTQKTPSLIFYGSFVCKYLGCFQLDSGQNVRNCSKLDRLLDSTDY